MMKLVGCFLIVLFLICCCGEFDVGVLPKVCLERLLKHLTLAWMSQEVSKRLVSGL